ncbi:MAG: hypothetical protein ABI614_20185, partial [Planctomycetota bacterium]
MRRKSRWDRFVIGLKSSFDVKSRRRRQSRRMFLEPLELRQMLTADLGDPGNTIDPATGNGNGTAWVDQLLGYEDFVGPSSGGAVPAAYETLNATPLDWQAAVGNATNGSPASGSAPDPGSTDLAANSTTALTGAVPNGYAIDTLASGTSLGMLDAQGANLPGSAVTTIGTMQQWDAAAGDSLNAWQSLSGDTGSLAGSLSGELSQVLQSQTATGGSADTSTSADPDGGASWANSASGSLTSFAGSWVTSSGDAAVLPNLGNQLTPSTGSGTSGDPNGEDCQSYDRDFLRARYSGIVTFSGLTLIQINVSDGSSAIVDLTQAQTVPDV